MSSVSIDELFSQALQGDYDDDDAWHAIHALQSIGTREVFERSSALCTSDEPLKRARAADILGQLGKTSENPTPHFPEESFRALTGMLDAETDSLPLSSVVAALGHLGNPAAIPLILPFSYHPDPGVRFGLAFALGCFADDKRGVSTLLKLMTDKDGEVRDWATFGLGVLGDFDSPEIREALFRNLSDEDEDVQEEAMAGLAKRKDLRALSHLIAALEGDDPSSEAFDAANFLLGRTFDPIEDPAECLKELKLRFPDANFQS
jgi:HEAT repeat protein